MVDYRNVKIPNGMIEEIEKLMESHKELGYRTVAEFVIDALRRRMEEFKKLSE